MKGKYKSRLKGKVAVVTGASKGIGKAVSLALAENGVKVALSSRYEYDLKRVSDIIDDEYGTENITIPTDVKEESQVKNLMKKTLDNFNKLDILVNNAGIIRYGDIENYPTEDYRAVMGTNVDGMFFCTREALPHLKETKGNLVFIGSFDSSVPRSFNPIYAASKWWTKGFAHSIESIVGKEGVGVTLINPSEVRTDIQDEEGKAYKKRFSSDEILDPEEIARAVVFALSQSETTTINEMNIFRKDKLGDFF
ncbi:MAG: SDR family oxidoreductase [Thermoplasmatota archaeon]